MIKLKNFISVVVTLVVFGVIVFNFDLIWSELKGIANIHPDLVIEPGNSYVKKDKFIFVNQVDDYIPYNYDDLKNIFYSVLNQGWEEFTFYCPTSYETCLSDVEKISYDEVLLSDINNYVHPYNSYSTIKTLYDDLGEVTIKVKHLYSDEEINKIDKEIDGIIKNNINDLMNTKEKIKTLHDYIINNTKYDVKRANDGSSNYDSARMLGLLYDHYAICSGYADVMAVMLEKLNIPNFKVASETHVWNAVYLNDEWLHLDLTWDDPVSASGKDILDHSYFLIDTIKLGEIDDKKEDHNFNEDRYMEFSN